MEHEKDRTAREQRGTETPSPVAHHPRGGSSYQHSLSARGIASSGPARSASDADLLASLERLEQAARHPFPGDEENETRRTLPLGRPERGGGAEGTSAERRLRDLRSSW